MEKTFNTVAEVIDFIDSFDGLGLVITDTYLLIDTVRERAEFEKLPDGDIEGILD